MIVHQMEVLTVFLNGTLEEEIYLQQSESYIQPGREHLLCKPKKSLYGLKHAPTCWNTTLMEFLESIQFDRNTAYPCVFDRMEGGDPTIIAVLRV